MHGLIGPTTNINIDNYALPWGHKPAMKGLSRNYSIIISPSDKGGSVVIMNSIHYNNKIKQKK